MNLWIRVDASMPRDKEMSGFARELGVVKHQAIGHIVALWCVVAEHATDGDLSDVDDDTLEEWAGWSRPRGRFAPLFRARFTENGVLRGWL
jgi:hypothetical protein